MAANATVPPLHSRRVEAWVHSVLNPLVDALRREQLLLERGNLSWRAYSRSCDYIRPIQEYLDIAQIPNLENFRSDPLNPGFAAAFDEHDCALREMESKVRQFFDRLMNSELFLKQVRDLVREFSGDSSHAAGQVGMTIHDDDLPKYVAEYLINNTKDLPAHYVTHGFWAQYKDRFPHLAEEFEPYKQRESFQNLQSAVGELRGISRALLNRLEEHRSHLCATFDIPAAPISANRTGGHATDDASSYILRGA